MRSPSNSLTARIVLLIFVIFATIYVIAYYFASDYVYSTRLNLSEQNIRQQVQITRERTLSYFERDQKLIEIGLEKGVYQQWMRSADNETLSEQAINELTVVCRLVDCFGWFLVSDISKNGFSFNRQDGHYIDDELQDEDQIWYQPLVESGRDFLIDSSFEAKTQINGVFLDYVVRENDQLLGLVGTYAKAEDVHRYLLPNSEQSSKNLLIDDRGTIRLGATDANDVINNFANLNWEAMFSEAVIERLRRHAQTSDITTEVLTLYIDNAEYLAAFNYIEQVEWFAVSLYPLSNPEDRFMLVAVTIVSIIILFFFIGITALVLNFQVVRPLLHLNEVVNAIDQGDFGVKAGKVGTDVIQNLASHIDMMTDTIAEQLTSLRMSNSALQKARHEAEKANKAKSEFLSNMSHEIRTPMNGVLGILQILEKSDLSQNARELVFKATYSANALLVIINDILDFSKIEANKLALEQRPFSMLEIVDYVMSDLRPMAEKKAIDFDAIIEPEFIDGWLGDYVRVRQILINLASNALKFTEEGGVIIKLKMNSNGQGVSLEVIDSGIGMSEEARQRIFDRFTQADTSTTRKYGGTGLGMAITVSLISLMDGSIEVKSVENIGTTVIVGLPLEPVTLSDDEQPVPQDDVPNLKGVRILVAEDNDINQTIIASMLEETNAKLVFAKNGAIAVEAFKKHRFDAVLMDIQMPEMDGIEAFSLIRAINRDVPIWALTANVMKEEVEHYSRLGFTGHIGKPINLNYLHLVLHQLAKT